MEWLYGIVLGLSIAAYVWWTWLIVRNRKLAKAPQKRMSVKQEPIPWRMSDDDDEEQLFNVRARFYLHEFDEEGVELNFAMTGSSLQHLLEAADEE